LRRRGAAARAAAESRPRDGRLHRVPRSGAGDREPRARGGRERPYDPIRLHRKRARHSHGRGCRSESDAEWQKEACMTEKKQRPKADIHTLAALISTHAPYDGSFELRLPGVHAIRVSQPHKELTHYTQQSCVCIVAQGAKTATVGEESFATKVGTVAVYSIY